MEYRPTRIKSLGILIAKEKRFCDDYNAAMRMSEDLEHYLAIMQEANVSPKAIEAHKEHLIQDRKSVV